PRREGGGRLRRDAAAVGRVPRRRAGAGHAARRGRRRAPMTRGVDARFVPLLGTAAVFALTVAYGSFAYRGFFSAQAFLNLLIDNAFLCIVGVGLTFVILTGGIDLSVGAVVALTTMISAALVEQHHWSAGAVIPLVLALGACYGAFMGWLIARFRLQPFIVT